MKLEEAIRITRQRIDDFEKEYLEENKKNPELYPLEVEDSNSGVFFEMIIDAIF